MKAINIKWNISINEAIQELKEKSINEAAKALNISETRYAGMNTEERKRYTYEAFSKSSAELNELFNLPDEVSFPPTIKEDNIEEWLYDDYGFEVKSYELIYDTEERYVLKIEGDYYAGRNQKYPDVFNISGNGPLGAKLLNYNEGTKLRKKYLKNGFEHVELELYDAKTYLERALQAILILEEERKKGKDPGYAIQNKAKRALEYLKQIN